MPYVFFNNNPKNARVGDCAVRAVSKAIGQDWNDVMGMVKVTQPHIYKAVIHRLRSL